MTRGLAGATQRGETELHFQPEVDLVSGELTGMEALLRWAHPLRGLLWPADFLPAARTEGLLPSLGRWVLGRCAAEASTWPVGARCWINISAEEAVEASWPVELAAVLAAAGTPSGAIVLDLPAAVLAAPGAPGLVEALHAAGAVVATAVPLTTLGAVETTAARPDLVAILRLVDEVSLGRRLAAAAGTEPTARAAVEALVATGVPVTASGVQTWAEAAALQQLGVRRASGFLFGAPQRADRTRWQLENPQDWRGSYVGDGDFWGATAATLEPTLAGALSSALPDSQQAPLLRPFSRAVPPTALPGDVVPGLAPVQESPHRPPRLLAW